jgi:hypothetical protein
MLEMEIGVHPADGELTAFVVRPDPTGSFRSRWPTGTGSATVSR